MSMKTNYKQFRIMLFTVTILVLADSSGKCATLIGHWTFDEGTGNTAFDSSGNGLNGTITDAVYTSGRVDSNALYFNGVSASVEVPNSDLLDPNTIGISLWFKADYTQSGYLVDLLDKGHGGMSTPYFAGYAIQNMSGVYGNGTSFPGVSTDMNWTDNNWHHLAVNLGEDGMQLYVDAVLVDSQLGQGPLVQNDSNLYFGRHRNLDRYYKGVLDDIRIYEGALSESDVQTLFGSGSGHCTAPSWCDGADINKDGRVDFKDIAVLANYWLVGANP